MGQRQNAIQISAAAAVAAATPGSTLKADTSVEISSRSSSNSSCGGGGGGSSGSRLYMNVTTGFCKTAALHKGDARTCSLSMNVVLKT